MQHTNSGQLWYFRRENCQRSIFSLVHSILSAINITPILTLLLATSLGMTLVNHKPPVQLKDLSRLFLHLFSGVEAAVEGKTGERPLSNCRQRQVADLAMVQAGAMITF